MKEIAIEEIEGFRIGHAESLEAATGCTVILCEQGAVGGVDVRGGAPGTRETDLLASENLVEEVHGVFLTGGSAFGLDVGGGVMKFLEEQGVGFDVEVARVPIVTGAVLFDLGIGSANVRPDEKMGYEAAQRALMQQDDREGSVGAGTGATVGKILGKESSMKGGLGTFAFQVGELKVGAVVAVNSFGDILDDETGEILAGVYDVEHQSFLRTDSILLTHESGKENTNRFSGNTTIGTVVTNASLTKANANKIASMAHDGFARTTRPSHSMVDGDTLFTLSTNEVDADLNVVGHLAAYVVQKAIRNGVKKATGIDGVRSYSEL
ncbi:peptidase [Pontibacillus halophilus JSM 076056 = DSM 19796]|uniref:Peptidase n=1 Tax=Pontibacillus halophilus JSM 076056 = DSM 19796 TaxID=1385510 RepID=A0A0A5GDV2_9BACI|nr:P1 family peptidase [Pontibacillus halophilus]KGX89305.1 peptidase [Pontibacillus halophilus JSM 076056 = DSM 19796]